MSLQYLILISNTWLTYTKNKSNKNNNENTGASLNEFRSKYFQER